MIGVLKFKQLRPQTTDVGPDMSENNEHKLYCTDYRPCRFCMVLLHFLFGVAMGPTKPQIWKFHWRAGRGSRRCFGIHEFHAKSSSSWGAKKKQNLDLGLEDVWSVVSCVFSCFCCNQLFFSGVMMLNYWLSYVIHDCSAMFNTNGGMDWILKNKNRDFPMVPVIPLAFFTFHGFSMILL